MLLDRWEQLAVRYLAHTYTTSDHLVDKNIDNSARRLAILEALKKEAGEFEPGDDVQVWLKRRHIAILNLREQVRDKVRSLLEPLTFDVHTLTAQVESWDELDNAHLFAQNIEALVHNLATEERCRRLQELAMDILDLAGRQRELETLIQN